MTDANQDHQDSPADEDESLIDPAPLDIDGEDIDRALPHRDQPDQDPPGAADAPVPS